MPRLKGGFRNRDPFGQFWKFGLLGLLLVAAVALGGVHDETQTRAPAIQSLSGRPLATLAACNPGTTTWSSDMLIDAVACPNGVTVASGSTLTITGGVHVFSNGPPMTVLGTLKSLGASNSRVSFDATADVNSWPGITVAPNGNATFSFTNVQHTFTAIKATSASNLSVTNSTIGPSYFDGIFASDTPLLVQGGVINNVGSHGIVVTESGNQLVKVDSVTLGSQVPFNDSSFVNTGTIGNEAISVSVSGTTPNQVTITNNLVLRAGAYGIHAVNANSPTISGNNVFCSGRNGIATNTAPLTECTGNPSPSYPAIYLEGISGSFAGVNNNGGSQNGIDAIAFHGSISSDVKWISPKRSNAGYTGTPLPSLGYVLDDSLTLNNSKLTVNPGDVVKIAKGSININGGTLDASSAGSLKVFTSIYDTSNGIAACPSILAVSCPSPTSSDWSGIFINGSSARGNINQAQIAYASTGVAATSIAGLQVTSTQIGPSLVDGVRATTTPIGMVGDTITNVGSHGVNLQYTAPDTSSISLDTVKVQTSGNEGILASGLTSAQAVKLTNNTVSGAGSTGIRLDGTLNDPVIQKNFVRGSGNSASKYPAIYLDGVNGDFTTNISGNQGSGNALDAILFHGIATTNFSWIDAENAPSDHALGYLLDAGLSMTDVTLTIPGGTVVKAYSAGGINLNGGALNALGTAPTVFTSLTDTSRGMQACPSGIVPGCAAPTSADWAGITLAPDPSATPAAGTIDNGTISYASTAITVKGGALTLNGTSILNAQSDGINAQDSSVSVTGPNSLFGSIGQHGISADLNGGGLLSVDDVTFALNSPTSEGILGNHLAGRLVSVTNSTVNGAGRYGLQLIGADNLNIQGNTINGSGNTAPGYPAISLPGVSATFGVGPANQMVGANSGSGNKIDAIAFDGNTGMGMVWQTARNSMVTHPLGYLLDGNFTMSGTSGSNRNVLTIPGGSVVKALGGGINLNGATLEAAANNSNARRIFTSLRDDSAGVPTCGTILALNCTPSAGDWQGIQLLADSAGNQAAGEIFNAWIKYAQMGIAISSQATSSPGASNFGLTIARSLITSSATDGISAIATPVSITDTRLDNSTGRGMDISLVGAAGGTGLQIIGDQVNASGSEGIYVDGLAGRPVWISDNLVRNTGASGIQLKDADELILRNNNICGAGSASINPTVCGDGTSADILFPAIYLNGVAGDFSSAIRANTGSKNGMDVIAFHGTALSSLAWKTRGTTSDLGYLLDGTLELDGPNTLTLSPGDLVKVLAGSITINGGSIVANGSGSNPVTFTSLRDNTGFLSCPSIFTGSNCGSPLAGDWSGLNITDDGKGHLGAAKLDWTQILYPTTGVAIDSGATSLTPPSPGSGTVGLIATNDTIKSTASDAVNATDTPIFVQGGTIGDAAALNNSIGGRGIVEAFETAPAGDGFFVDGVYLGKTRKEAIFGNFLSGHPVTVTNNTISGAGWSGIQLRGADDLTLTGNHVLGSGGTGAPASVSYPAIYLNGVSGDFSGMTANVGVGNAIDAMVIHGKATKDFSWVTPYNDGTVQHPLGYVLDGSLTVGYPNTLTVSSTDVIKAWHGAIVMNGGTLNVTGAGATFTSLRDGSVGDAFLAQQLCQSVFVGSGSSCQGSAGDWDGLLANADSNGNKGTITADGSSILFADPAITINGGNPISLDGATIENVSGDAISISGTSGNTFTNMTVDNVTGDGIKLLAGSDSTISTSRFSKVAGVAINGAGGKVNVDCTSLHANGIGLQFGANGSTLTNSDDYGNTSYDVNALGGALTASDVFYNSGSGPNVGGTASYFTNNDSSPLTDQHPQGTITLTSDNPLANDQNGNQAIGVGLAHLHVDTNRPMNVSIGQPSAQFALVSGATANFDFVTDKWSTDGRTLTYKDYDLGLATAEAGINQLGVKNGRSCIPAELTNPSSNLMPEVDKTFVAAILPTSLVPQPATGVYGGTTDLEALLTSGTTGLPDELVSFQMNTNQPLTVQTCGNSPVIPTCTGGSSAGQASDTTASLGSIDAGSYATGVSASFPGDPNLFYTPAPAKGATPITASLTVTKAPLTVSADNATKTYGDDNPQFTASYTGFVLNQDKSVLGGALAFNTTATKTSPVGSYTVTPAGLTSNNYAISFVAGTLTIDPASLTVTADNQSRKYGEANPTFTATGSGLAGTDTLSGEGLIPPTITLSTLATTASSVGSYDISVTGPATTTDGNYNVNYVKGTLTVKQANLTLTADDQTRAYGAANPTLTYATTGLVNGDTLSSLGIVPSTSTSASATTGVGSYTISMSGNVSSTTNYTIQYVDGTLSVTKAGLTITADNQSKNFGDANPSLTYTTSGLVNGDDLTSIGLTVSIQTTATTSSRAGLYPITVTTTGSPANYSVNTSQGTLTVNAVVPGAPSIDSVVRANGAAVITFSPPANDGGDSITQYAATSNPGSLSKTALGTDRSMVVSGLTNGTSYTFTITATNSAGTGSPSGASSAVTPVAYSAAIAADSPVLYWRLGESSGTSAADSTANSNNGTYSSGVTLGVTGALAGDSDTAVALDGTTGNVQDASPSALPTTNTARTLEAWFNIGSTVTTAQPILSYGSNSGLEMFTVSVEGSKIELYDGTETISVTAGSSLNDGGWHQLAVTYDGSTTVKIYLDGTQVGTDQATSAPLNTTLDSGGFQAGSDGSAFLDGKIDEVAVYASALSASKIADHYTVGTVH